MKSENFSKKLYHHNLHVLMKFNIKELYLKNYNVILTITRIKINILSILKKRIGIIIGPKEKMSYSHIKISDESKLEFQILNHGNDYYNIHFFLPHTKILFFFLLCK